MSFKGFPSFLMCVLISFKPPACADAHHAANLPSCKPGNTSYSGFDYVLVDPRHRCGETAGNASTGRADQTPSTDINSSIRSTFLVNLTEHLPFEAVLALGLAIHLFTLNRPILAKEVGNVVFY